MPVISDGAAEKFESLSYRFGTFLVALYHRAALTLAAAAESSAQTLPVDLSDRALCLNALNRERSEWDSDPLYSKYIAEASRRSFTVHSCRELLGDEPSTSADSGTSEQHAFLEAALFFLTGVDATSDEIVSDREIVLHQYPLVAYLVDGNRCAVRIRNTHLHVVWQMDFCKIASYEWSFRRWWWHGKDAF